MSKKIIIPLAIITSMLVLFSCSHHLDIEAEKDAIKKVIAYETQTAYAQNMEELEKTWVHESYALWTYVHKDYQSEYTGWDAINAFFKNYIETNPPIEEEAIQENFTFRFYANGAWVTFEQYNKSDKENNPQYIPVRHIRVLEKTADGWKIAFMGAIDRDSYKVEESEE